LARAVIETVTPPGHTPVIRARASSKRPTFARAVIIETVTPPGHTPVIRARASREG